VHFVAEFVDERGPRLVRASYTIGGLGMTLAASGLFFDPAHAEAGYDWARGSAAQAGLTPLGLGLALAALSTEVFATYRVIVRSAEVPDLRVAAGLTGASALFSIVEVVARLAVLPSWLHLAAPGSLLAVGGFSYVLLGRFTRVDAELESRKEQLAQSHDHLRLTQEEILKTEQLAAIGELSAVVAHEVRNPLAIIKNAVAGLRRSELRPEDGDTLLSILDEETDRLNRLVNDLLTYAKPIPPSSDTAPVDLCRLAGHAVELAAGGSRDISHIEVELELDPDVARVEGDEALLRHALINIVDNALQAMPSGGTLTVSCRDVLIDGRPHVCVDFHDTGEGMDTMVRTRARDPFFTTRQSGTGLGLAIVDRVAQVHGGRVEIESRHGQGTAVRLALPCERLPDES